MKPDIQTQTRSGHTILEHLDTRVLFIVWDSPRGTHRAEYLGKHLGAETRHVYITRAKGWYIAPIKYLFQTIMTLVILFRHRAQLIFVQNPPIFAVLSVYLYSLLTSSFYIIDSHTDALLAPFWKWTLPLHQYLSQKAITTMVTNEHLHQLVTKWGAHAFVLRDVPCTIPERQDISLSTKSWNVVVVSSASYDEPIDQVMVAARQLPDIDFYVTGNYRSKSSQHIVKQAPANMHFVGYIPDKLYFGLLEKAQVVMCLTTEDHTYQSGASEALWLGTPIITSDWPLLRSYFNKGTIHVDNTAGSIVQAVNEIRNNLSVFEDEVRQLQTERQQEWLEKTSILVQLIEKSLPWMHRNESAGERGGLS